MEGVRDRLGPDGGGGRILQLLWRAVGSQGTDMKLLAAFLLWCLLFVACWPLALLALVLLPFIWVLSLPFRVLFYAVEGLLALIRALILLPARLVGW